MVIAVDASGGDYAPQEIVKGAVQAAREHNLELILLGDRATIEVLLAQEGSAAGIEVVDAPQAITCHEQPVQAVRGKPDSSIVKGIKLVRDGAASAFVSAGNTGAVLAAAYLYLKNVEGIERPALGVVIPVSDGSPFLLIDGGANADCRPGYLLQFARLGNIFARLHLGVQSPRIGLLNNGEEEVKGSSLTIEAHKLLRESGLNFTGNIEGQDILKGRIDVLVTDGFTGNILLKSLEGFGDFLKGVIGSALPAGAMQEAAMSSGNGGLGSMLRRMDFSEYGGSCMLGVNGNVIVSHGRSKAKAMRNAVRFAGQAAGSGLVDAIRRELSVI
ncbi:MAG: phosphate acyltransferase PlsX [Dehalococcoidia bacterium]|nr:phosphate acyltransferase PlsX [Dehalococcoidia bacterium]MDD5494909.1 phosphate acyltransferase PlsX [Dehalococcoidia bacterium]